MHEHDGERMLSAVPASEGVTDELACRCPASWPSSVTAWGGGGRVNAPGRHDQEPGMRIPAAHRRWWQRTPVTYPDVRPPAVVQEIRCLTQAEEV